MFDVVAALRKLNIPLVHVSVSAVFQVANDFAEQICDHFLLEVDERRRPFGLALLARLGRGVADDAGYYVRAVFLFGVLDHDHIN